MWISVEIRPLGNRKDFLEWKGLGVLGIKKIELKKKPRGSYDQIFYFFLLKMLITKHCYNGISIHFLWAWTLKSRKGMEIMSEQIEIDPEDSIDLTVTYQYINNYVGKWMTNI